MFSTRVVTDIEDGIVRTATHVYYPDGRLHKIVFDDGTEKVVYDSSIEKVMAAMRGNL